VRPFFIAVPASLIRPNPELKSWEAPELTLYPGALTLGYGNFLSPLVDARYMSTTSDPWQFASKFHHQSFGKGPVPWMEEESKESHTELSGDGSYFLEKAELYSSLSIRRDAYRYYGENLNFVIPPNVDFAGPLLDPNQQLQGNIKLGIRDVEKVGRFGYEGFLVLNGFKDSFLAREGELGFQGTASFRPSKEVQGNLAVVYYTTDTKDREYDLNRNFLSIRPQGNFSLGNVKLTAGLVLVEENDSLEKPKSGIRIFPVIKSSYQLGRDFTVSASISGDVQRNTYRSFVQENPFLGPSKQLLNTVTPLSIASGVEGSFSDKVIYRGGFDLRRQNNLHFFVNSYADTSRFELVYDPKVTVLQLHSSIEISLTEKYSLQTRVDYFHYNLTFQEVAWHRPTWILQINQRLTPIKKLSAQANLQAMGGLQARGFGTINTIPATIDVIKLPIVLDLHAYLDFDVSSRITVFAEGNNLLNRNNNRHITIISSI
ncbi:MAG: hypothetical protein EB038_07605, partial [Cyclobacteriaceae bacterium]|nr:hypothetical protein [Cyclobacteriaceae bacterium]